MGHDSVRIGVSLLCGAWRDALAESERVPTSNPSLWTLHVLL